MNAIAAVPDYVGDDFKEAAPGHRFGLYLGYWRQGDWSKAGDSAYLARLDEGAPDILVEEKSAWRERYAVWIDSGNWDSDEVVSLAQALFGLKGGEKVKQDPGTRPKE